MQDACMTGCLASCHIRSTAIQAVRASAITYLCHVIKVDQHSCMPLEAIGGCHIGRKGILHRAQMAAAISSAMPGLTAERVSNARQTLLHLKAP